MSPLWVMQPGQRTLPVKSTSSLVVSPFEGGGHAVVEGQRFDFKKNR